MQKDLNRIRLSLDSRSSVRIIGSRYSLIMKRNIFKIPNQTFLLIHFLSDKREYAENYSKEQEETGCVHQTIVKFGRTLITNSNE